MRKIAFTSAILLCTLAFIVPAQSSRNSDEHTKWISESLREIQTIKVGKTRADLLEIFTTEGGISTLLRRTYVYRNCPYIKIDVEFEAVERPMHDEGGVMLKEDNRDVIKSISKPYLEWSILD